MGDEGIPASALQEHFDGKYRNEEDPWRYRDSWYERRKYDVTTASLGRERYGRCWEPACSIGELTSRLAKRCDLVDASDISRTAIDIATDRLASTNEVSFAVAALPYDPPAVEYDLIVMSEILYYLDDESVERVLQTAYKRLRADGELVIVHWRHHPEDAWVSGDVANARVRADGRWHSLVTHVDEHFVLDVFRLAS